MEDQEFNIISLRTHLQLQTLGLNIEDIPLTELRPIYSDELYEFVYDKHGHVKMNFIKVNWVNDIRLAIPASIAISNPKLNFLTLIGQQHIDGFPKSVKLNRSDMKISRIKQSGKIGKIIGWNQLNACAAMLITETDVYRWPIDGESKPLHVFKRTGTNAYRSIIGIDEDFKNQWQLIISSAKDNDKLNLLHIYKLGNEKIYTWISAHVGCFIQYKSETDMESVTLLCYTAPVQGKIGIELHITEIGQTPVGNQPFEERITTIPNWAIENDIPKSIMANDTLGIIIVITNCGYVRLFEIESATSIYSQRISLEEIIHVTEYKEKNEIFLLNKIGEVLSFRIDENNLVLHVMEKVQNTELAYRLTNRCNPGKKIIENQDTNFEHKKIVRPSAPPLDLDDTIIMPTTESIPTIPPRPPLQRTTLGPRVLPSSPQRALLPPPLPSKPSPQQPRPPPPPPPKPPKRTLPSPTLATVERAICVVCNDAEKCVVVEPCHHMSMCRSCANKVFNQQRRCPICRGPIKTLINVYLS